MAIFGKKKKKETFKTGRDTESNIYSTYGKNRYTTTTNLLQRLRCTHNVYDAIDLLIEEHPDASMAYTTLVALACQGGEIEFSGNYSESIKKEWVEFSARINGINSTGLEGLLKQLTGNAIAYGASACEIVIDSDATDIEDIYIIPPKTIEWKIEKVGNKYKYIPYQLINGKRINLSNSNFIWVPFLPKTDSPEGTLMFESAIQAIDMQLDFFNSSQIVLYRVGVPRFNIEINKERFVQNQSEAIRQDPIELNNRYQEYENKVVCTFENLGVENDIIRNDDTKVDTIGGNNAAFFQGISAFADIIDTQVLNSLKVLGTLMNRLNNKGSFALSSVEFKIICDMLMPLQKAEKRIVEDIARLWLRVKGYDSTAKYTYNPIEWESFKDKYEYMLLKQEHSRRNFEYGNISHDESAKDADKQFADRKDDGMRAYVKKVSDK